MVGWHHRLNGHEFELASLSITGKPGMLQSMGSQRVGDSWATELSLTFGMACIHLACHKMDTPRHLPWAGWGGKSNENYGNVVKCNSFVTLSMSVALTFRSKKWLMLYHFSAKLLQGFTVVSYDKYFPDPGVQIFKHSSVLKRVCYLALNK